MPNINKIVGQTISGTITYTYEGPAHPTYFVWAKLANADGSDATGSSNLSAIGGAPAPASTTPVTVSGSISLVLNQSGVPNGTYHIYVGIIDSSSNSFVAGPVDSGYTVTYTQQAVSGLSVTFS